LSIAEEADGGGGVVKLGFSPVAVDGGIAGEGEGEEGISTANTKNNDKNEDNGINKIKINIAKAACIRSENKILLLLYLIIILEQLLSIVSLSTYIELNGKKFAILFF
jgi:hypothetical protein